MLKGMAFGILCALVAATAFLVGMHKVNIALENEQSLDELILSDADKMHVVVHTDVISEPYLFAGYSDGELQYYFIESEGGLYIAYMDSEDYSAIVSGIENNGSYTIKGFTDEMKDDVIRFAKQSLKQNGYGMTDEEFEQYFCKVMVVISDLNKPDMFLNLTFAPFMVILCFGGIAVIVIPVYAGMIIKFRKKAESPDKLQIYEGEIASPGTIWLPKLKVYLTPHYIISLAVDIEVVRYEEIVLITESVCDTNYSGEVWFVTAKCRDGKEVHLGQASKSSISEIYNDELRGEVECICEVATEHNAGIQVNEPV